MTEREYGPVRSLIELEGTLKEITGEFASATLLYRGQCNLYPKIRSGRARINSPPTSPALESGWLSLATLLLHSPEKESDPGLAKAILQHYGSPTYYVDLTSDIGVAAWFATHKYHEQTNPYVGTAFRLIKHAHYIKRTEGTAYVLVLAVDAEKLKARKVLYDLSCLPQDVTRPHRQKGWLMLDRPPMLPTPNDFWVATIKIDCAHFSHPSSLEDIFPPPRSDGAYAAMRGLPFVQIPTAYLKKDDKIAEGDIQEQDVSHKTISDQESEKESSLCFAARAIDLCDYGNMMDRNSYDHKWEDYTLYEPHPMRMWKRWRFELETLHDGLVGNICNSVKITMSPRAQRICEEINEIPCEWLDVGRSDLFFTFAALDHDKVIEHGPPYDGVWVHKSDEFLLETPMQADHDVLNVHGGHGYLLQQGEVTRQHITNSCKCKDPESHDKRVRKVLRVAPLVDAGILILVPHPWFSDWYVVL